MVKIIMAKKIISLRDVDIMYGNRVIFDGISFDVFAGDVFVIMGPSGCGKSTLMRVMTGLMSTDGGRISILGHDMSGANNADWRAVMQHCGVLFQGGALFGTMTLAENVALPLRTMEGWSDAQIDDAVNRTLDLVGLSDFCDFYPAQISGGMTKRAGLARALVRNPEILFLDEPSSGLDPISTHQLNDIIHRINKKLGTTVVMVSHDVPSILDIGTNSIFIDPAIHNIADAGNPRTLLRHSTSRLAKQFLTMGGNK